MRDQKKRCSRCGKENPLKHIWCNDCQKQYRIDNKDSINEAKRIAYAKNPDVKREYVKKNIDAVKAYRKAYYQKNKEAIISRIKAYNERKK